MREKLGGWEHGLEPETISCFRQNTIELVIRDARWMLGLDEEECEKLRQIMLARGVAKWFKARRDVIRLKAEVKGMITDLQPNYDKHNPVHKERLKLLNWFRQELRTICHQPRWVEWPRGIATAAKAEKGIVVKGPRA
ncbi:hypothetical protein KKD19_01240 [Patescibacteria group bacterium]|nr:hypothetical protein [Patescibacteria group bacterium]MBU4511857.1 hypothetical protein [Patescibacteria group bacterium]MCG2693252.1 hypothetical protein [Candidatus Parcubacteria bacterium]